MKAEPVRTPSMRGRIDEALWERIEAEFTLPALEQVRGRLEEVTADPEPVLTRLVRVFIGEGTYCPGFQFQTGGEMHPVVAALFDRAMELGGPVPKAA